MEQELRDLVNEVIAKEGGITEEALTSDLIIPKDVIQGQTIQRFSGSLWLEKMRGLSILLIGLGGIGSNAVYQLARLCPKQIVVMDGDTVDDSNMSGQWYSHTNIGNTKVNALLSNMEFYISHTSLFGITEMLKEGKTDFIENYPIVVTGFDNMEARSIAFEAWQKYHKDNPNAIFIDARCSIDDIFIYTVTGNSPHRIDRYEEEFFTDIEADVTLCTLKQTTYIACLTGSLLTNILVNWVSNSVGDLRGVPFKLHFSAEDYSLNVEDLW